MLLAQASTSGYCSATQQQLHRVSAGHTCRLSRPSARRSWRPVSSKRVCIAQQVCGTSRKPADCSVQWSLAQTVLKTFDRADPQHRSVLLLGVGACALAVMCSPAAAADHLQSGPHFHPTAADLNQLASNEDFWQNLGAYGRYFVSVMLGTAYIMTKPVVELLKRPRTAVLVVAGLGALYFFVSTTVSAMLGVNELFEYQY